METDRRLPEKSPFDSSPCESQSGRLSPADISRNVRPKSCHTSARWSVNGYVALITDEASRSRVKDHYTKELQVAVRVPLSVRKETGRRLRIDQFWPKLLNLARKDLRSLDGQKPGFCSEARRMFRPVCPRSVLSQLNCIWVRKTSVDSEISIIDFLGVERRKYRERESKKKQISWAHEEDCTNDYVSPSCQLDAIFHTLPIRRGMTPLCHTPFATKTRGVRLSPDLPKLTADQKRLAPHGRATNRVRKP